MTENTLVTSRELVWMLWGAAVLFIFAVAFAMRNRSHTLPGSRGHRIDEDETPEVVRPDGYVDSFAGVIEEAGGALPPIVIVFFIGIWIWWLVYLILNWTPY